MSPAPELAGDCTPAQALSVKAASTAPRAPAREIRAMVETMRRLRGVVILSSVHCVFWYGRLFAASSHNAENAGKLTHRT